MKKPQLILIGITAIFLCLVLGIFIGRNLTKNYVSVENLGVTDVNGNHSIGTTTESQNTGSGEQNSVTGDESTTENKIEDKKININTADAEQLTLLPGIGEVIAQRIVDYRTENGPFQSVDDIINVSGIGETKLEQLRPYAKVD